MKIDDWFAVHRVDEDTFVLSENRHWEQTNCYLLLGRDRGLLIDTGLGIGNIGEVVRKLTEKSVAAVATHIHWDHIGGHSCFGEFYAHEAELSWLCGRFPLPLQAIRHMVVDRCQLPPEFDVQKYRIFQGVPRRLLTDGETVDLGGRQLRALHTPGHAPGHLCFFEEERGYLFSGDLVYKGCLYANYPSTNPQAYLNSLEKVAELPVKRVFPGHHDLDIQPELIIRMRDALRQLDRDGKLHHGSGLMDYGEWSISL